MTRLVLVALCTLSLTACFTHKVHVGSGGNQEVHSSWDFFFLNGWIGEGSVNVHSLCPSGNATVEIRQTVVDSCIGYGLCGGLMVPQTTKVYCGPDRRAQLEDDEVEALLNAAGVRDALARLVVASF